MSSKGETLFRKRFVRQLKEIPDVDVESIQQVAIRGSLDLRICAGGWCLVCELKDEDGKVSELQRVKLGYVQNAGGFAIAVRPSTAEAALEFVRYLAANPPTNYAHAAAHLEALPMLTAWKK